MKNFKSMTAVAMSAAMVMSMGMPVFAADPEVEVDAPIYSFEVLDVVVPTTYAVAFNPDGLTVKTGDSTTSTDQILSRNYGIINKGNKDQLITVTLTVEDQNTGDNVAIFVDDADAVTNAKEGEYKIHLTAVPADASGVQVGTTPAAADKDTAATDLDNVTMTGATANAVTLKAGENKIGFKLDEATYSPIAGSEVTLGAEGATNNVASSYEITALADDGAGITAFTFGGEMNANANWSKLTSGVKITAVYSNEIAPSDATVVDGTGAMVGLDAAPSIAVTDYEIASSVDLQVSVELGTGGKTATGISSIKNLSANVDVPAARYSLSGNTLTISGAFIANNMSSIKSADGLRLSVVFDDTDQTAVTITLKEASATN